jgi:hypothetical protein
MEKRRLSDMWKLPISRSVYLVTLLLAGAVLYGADDAAPALNTAVQPDSGALTAAATGGLLVLILGVVGIAILAIFLIVAPLKLYSIHTAIQRTNQLLEWQGKLLSRLISEQKVPTDYGAPPKKWEVRTDVRPGI